MKKKKKEKKQKEKKTKEKEKQRKERQTERKQITFTLPFLSQASPITVFHDPRIQATVPISAMRHTRNFRGINVDNSPKHYVTGS